MLTHIYYNTATKTHFATIAEFYTKDNLLIASYTNLSRQTNIPKLISVLDFLRKKQPSEKTHSNELINELSQQFPEIFTFITPQIDPLSPNYEQTLFPYWNRYTLSLNTVKNSYSIAKTPWFPPHRSHLVIGEIDGLYDLKARKHLLASLDYVKLGIPLLPPMTIEIVQQQILLYPEFFSV